MGSLVGSELLGAGSVRLAGNEGGGSGPPGSGVESVTGAAPGIVDNTDPQNPIIEAQFGADTTVQKANSGAALVDALRLLLTLTSNTPGSEASKWLVKLLVGGAPVDALSIEPNALGVGDRIYFQNDVGQDTYIERSENTISFVCGGQFIGAINGGGIILNGGVGAQLQWGSAGVQFTSATGGIKLHANGPNVGNVQLAEDVAMNTDDTQGFVTIPQMPGPPTADPINVAAGQVPMVISNPGDSPSKLYFFLNGVWVSTVLS